MSKLNTTVLTVFKNNDSSDQGTKVLLNPSYVGDNEGFKEELSQTVEDLSNDVDKIYDTNGKLINKLSEYKENHNYILVCVGETLNISKVSKYAFLDDSGEEFFSGVSSSDSDGKALEKAYNIFVFRNGDKHHKGVKIVLNRDNIWTMDQLKEIMTDKVQPLTGAIRKVYTPDGVLVKNLDEFADNGKYIAVGGELTLNTDKMAKAIFEEEEEDDTYEEEEVVHHKYVSPMEKKEITKFGTQAEKARVIRVFANGDKHDKGVKVTLNTKTILTHAQLKQLLNNKITLFTGAVQKVYTPKGKLVKSLDEYVDGGKYVAAAGEGFNKSKVPIAALKVDEEEEGVGQEEEKPKKKKVTRKKVIQGPKLGKTKFGVQATKAKVLFIFQNKDKYDKGTKITYNPKTCRTHDQLKQLMTNKLKMQTGPVKKVYTTSGKLVRSLDSYEDYGKYVACGGEAFDIGKLSPHALKDDDDTELQEEEEEEVKTTTTTTTKKKKKSTTGTTGKKKVIKGPKLGTTKFGTQAEKAKVMYFFRNGDKHDSGVRYTLNTKRVLNMTQLKDALTNEVRLLTGSVRKIYSMEGSLVKSFDDLVDGAPYLCCGPEKPQFEKVSKASLEDIGKDLEYTPKGEEEAEVKFEYKSPVKKKTIKKFGTQAEKARNIYVYRNADKHDQGSKIVINPHKIKTHEQLKYLITQTINPITGAIKKVYNTKNKLVRSLDDYVDGASYVACGGEKLDLDKYPLALKE